MFILARSFILLELSTGYTVFIRGKCNILENDNDTRAAVTSSISKWSQAGAVAGVAVGHLLGSCSGSSPKSGSRAVETEIKNEK